MSEVPLFPAGISRELAEKAARETRGMGALHAIRKPEPRNPDHVWRDKWTALSGQLSPSLRETGMGALHAIRKPYTLNPKHSTTKPGRPPCDPCHPKPETRKPETTKYQH